MNWGYVMHDIGEDMRLQEHSNLYTSFPSFLSFLFSSRSTRFPGSLEVDVVVLFIAFEGSSVDVGIC